MKAVGGKRKALVLACVSMAFLFPPAAARSQQAQSADSLVVVSLPEGQRIELVWVEGGEFTMGSNRGVTQRHQYMATRPEHRVKVGSYFMARFEVTQGVWRAVMGENPSKFAGSNSDSLPVEQVSWNEAQRFVTMLSQLTGRRFRLPTEAEWEYAARGGVKSHKLTFAGCDRSQLEKHAWFTVNSERSTHPVGSLAPNELGLYDMSGNVAEWCSDWMAPYDAADQTDPRGPRVGSSRILRGGHYNSASPACSVYDRSWYVPTATSEYFGLRVVLDEETEED